MRTKCLSVRLSSLYEISDKCLMAIDFNGNEALIPKSQYFGRDMDVQKSEAHWIGEWILKQKQLVYSIKKVAWFDVDTRNMLPRSPTKNPVSNKRVKHGRKKKR